MLETRKKTEKAEDETRGEIGELKVLANAYDALLLLGAARVVKNFLDFLEERLERYGWKLVWKKSHARIPSLDLLDETPR